MKKYGAAFFKRNGSYKTLGKLVMEKRDKNSV